MTIGLDISVLNDRQRVGIAVYTYNLIDALLKINKKDKFILFGIATFETFNYLKNLDLKKYANVEMKIYRLPARAFRVAFLSWQKLNFPPIENFLGPVDIFHSFNWFLPPQRNGKKVATVFDMTPLLFPKFHLEKTVNLEKVRLVRIKDKADLVITISENSKEDFLKFSPTSWVEVIFPGISDNFKVGSPSEIKTNKEKVNRVLDKYGLNSNFILSVGTLEPRKNIKNLIAAYLQSKISEKLVLVGNWGWEDNNLEGLIKSNSEKIILTGYISDEDLPYLYNQALCLVYPSFYEGFGMPVLEALSCGTAVICSNTSSLPEVGGDAVLYIDPKDVLDITKALKTIMNKKLRAKLINKGLKQASKFSWEKSAKSLNKLYQAL